MTEHRERERERESGGERLFCWKAFEAMDFYFQVLPNTIQHHDVHALSFEMNICWNNIIIVGRVYLLHA